MRVAAQIDVNAPADAVWAFVDDPGRYLHFMSGVTRWEVVGEQASGLGGGYRMLMAVGSPGIGGAAATSQRPGRSLPHAHARRLGRDRRPRRGRRAHARLRHGLGVGRGHRPAGPLAGALPRDRARAADARRAAPVLRGGRRGRLRLGRRARRGPHGPRAPAPVAAPAQAPGRARAAAHRRCRATCRARGLASYPEHVPGARPRHPRRRRRRATARHAHALLRARGPSHHVGRRRHAALDEPGRGQFDVILLDVALGPGPTGYDVARALRARRNVTPVIMLTALDSEADAVQGLEAGPDDYVTKPFGLAELRSRIRAVLRRAHGHLLDDGLLEIANVVLDQRQREVSVDGRPVRLTFAEFELLQCLMARPGRLQNRQELLRAIWGDSAYRDPRAIDVHIRHLREKLEEQPQDPKLILTVRGAGYRFRDR